jgi:hypothetical protein
VPVACGATAANVAAFAVMARIRAVFADRGYGAECHRELCRAFGAEPHIRKRGQPRGSGLGGRRWPVERSNARVLETWECNSQGASRCATTGSASSSSSCYSKPPAYSWLQDGTSANSGNRL